MQKAVCFTTGLSTLVIASLCLLVSGCSDMTITRSGLLNDYSKLQPFVVKKTVLEDSNAVFWEKPGVDWNLYTAVKVEPVQIIGPAKYSDTAAKDKKEIASFLESTLLGTFSKDYQVAGVKPMRTLRIRAAVSDVDPSNPVLNIIFFVGAYLPWDTGGSSIEVEIADAHTGETLAAMVACGNGSPIDLINSLKELGQAKKVVSKWTTRLHDKMQHDSYKQLARGREAAGMSYPF